MGLKADEWWDTGSLVKEILKKGRSLIRPGAKIVDICEELELIIRNEGYKPAFPVNISINEIAAHYTADPYDRSRIPNSALVKLDVGVVSKNGAISDAAITIPINVDRKLELLVKVTKEALLRAIETIRDGVSLGEIGRVIWEVAHEQGFGVLRDLGGHQINRWQLHAGITIPNVPRRFTPKLREGMIIAIEPFLIAAPEDSRSKSDMSHINIFSIVNPHNDRILGLLYSKFKKLPFALRWLKKAKEDMKFYRSMYRYLLERHMEGKVAIYPALVEIRGRWVAQFEHTVLVKTNSAEILTG